MENCKTEEPPKSNGNSIHVKSNNTNGLSNQNANVDDEILKAQNDNHHQQQQTSSVVKKKKNKKKKNKNKQGTLEKDESNLSLDVKQLNDQLTKLDVDNDVDEASDSDAVMKSIYENAKNDSTLTGFYI